jgi:hypothetical protein
MVVATAITTMSSATMFHSPDLNHAPFSTSSIKNIIGYEVRKKPTFWHCLTGTKPRPRIFLNDHARRSRADLLDYERLCYEEDFVQPRRHHAPPHDHGIYERTRTSTTEQIIPDCTGCIYCFYDHTIGRRHRPGPRLGRGLWRYAFLGPDYDYDRWDPAPYWDEYWLH